MKEKQIVRDLAILNINYLLTLNELIIKLKLEDSCAEVDPTFIDREWTYSQHQDQNTGVLTIHDEIIEHFDVAYLKKYKGMTFFLAFIDEDTDKEILEDGEGLVVEYPSKLLIVDNDLKLNVKEDKIVYVKFSKTRQ